MSDSKIGPLVSISIKEPDLKEMFYNNKASLLCQVTVQTGTVSKIRWEDQNNKLMVEENAETPTNGGQRSLTLKLDVTFEEWARGIKRICVVDHDDSLDPIKKTFERTPGKKDV